MQKVCDYLGIKQQLTPVYHLQTNMLEATQRYDTSACPDAKASSYHLDEKTVNHKFDYESCQKLIILFPVSFSRNLRTFDQVQHYVLQVVQSTPFVPLGVGVGPSSLRKIS